MQAIVQHIDELLRKQSNVKNAAQMKAYMKGLFPFLGVKAPQRREVSRMVWQDFKVEIIDNWKEIVWLLWEKEEREFQHFAQDLISKVEKKLNTEDLSFIEKLITTKSWWDSVDFLATHGVGTILKQDTGLKISTARRYMGSDNLWLKRTALIFQLMYKGQTDRELLFEMIDRSLGTKEFFINKASGWALRQLSKCDREVVVTFLKRREGQLSGLTIREASKYI